VKRFDQLGHSGATTIPSVPDDAILTSRVRVTAWCFLILAGLIEAVFSRRAVWADGISYLDMGDAMVRGDWKMVVNAYWSPLYPFLQGLTLRLLKPSAYSQFDAVIAETKRRRGYQAKGSLPSDLWQQRISTEWAALLSQYATLR
jgi:hypothetical protein